jgi:anti-sigma factor RsiW
MCDVSGKLIAWMDGELPENEAAYVERHVRDCSECRRCAEAYTCVSRLVIAYCDATATEAKPRRERLRWMPALVGAAAAALLLFLLRPAAPRQSPTVARAANPSPASVLKTPSAPVKPSPKAVPRHHGNATANAPSADWEFADPAIQIIIPADAMFAPGAVPEGTIFRADLSMASDGSVQGLRLLQ